LAAGRCQTEPDLHARHEIHDVLTLDERHFRTLTADGRPFRLLLAEA
jgi:hypothetical protein